MSLHNQKGLDAINGRTFIGNTLTVRADVNQAMQCDVYARGESLQAVHVHVHGHETVGLCRVSG